MPHHGDFIQFLVFGAFFLLAMFGATLFVELFQHADGAVRFDDGQPTTFDLDGQPVRLFGEQLLLRVEHHPVALGFQDLINVDPRPGQGGSTRIAQLGDLVAQRRPLIGEDLLGAIGVGERTTKLVAVGGPQLLQRLESETVFAHEIDAEACNSIATKRHKKTQQLNVHAVDVSRCPHFLFVTSRDFS
jgi:hypothetical protein